MCIVDGRFVETRYIAAVPHVSLERTFPSFTPRNLWHGRHRYSVRVRDDWQRFEIDRIIADDCAQCSKRHVRLVIATRALSAVRGHDMQSKVTKRPALDCYSTRAVRQGDVRNDWMDAVSANNLAREALMTGRMEDLSSLLAGPSLVSKPHNPTNQTVFTELIFPWARYKSVFPQHSSTYGLTAKKTVVHHKSKYKMCSKNTIVPRGFLALEVDSTGVALVVCVMYADGWTAKSYLLGYG